MTRSLQSDMNELVSQNSDNDSTVFGIRVDNPHELASFLLTQLHVKSGVNCVLGHAYIPGRVDHSAINWEGTIKILNDALRNVKPGDDDANQRVMPLSYDPQLRIVEQDLHDHCFFLSENNICTFKALGRDIERLLPRGAMLQWIRSEANTPKVDHDMIDRVMTDIFEKISVGKVEVERGSNDNRGRSR